MPAGDETLAEGVRALNLSLPADRIALMLRYLDLLYAANASLNLTRVPREEAISRHLLESLALLTVADPPGSSRVLDLGSGGGIPGIPLAIARPQWHVTLMDARGKKVEAAAAFTRELGLGNVASVHARAEEAAQCDAFRGAFDLVTARAVAPLSRLVEWMAPFLRRGGLALAMKGSGLDAELAGVEPALDQAGMRIQEVRPTPVPFLNAQRTVVVMQRYGRVARPRGRRR